MVQALLIGVVTGFFYTFCAFSSILTAIQFSLRQGGMAGFIAGMGHATAQIAWIAIAVGAASLGTDVLRSEISHYKFIAATLLFLLGIKLLFSSPVSSHKIPNKSLASNLNAYFTVFTIAISAPARIIGYLALFMLMGTTLITSADFITKQMLLVGTLLGIVIWWIIFSLIMAKFKIKPSKSQIEWLQRITALILIILAVSVCFYPL